MAGTEMKNTILIALVVLVLLFVVYQYDPSFFGLLGSREGFTNGSVTGRANSLANSSDSKLPGKNMSNGMAEMFQNTNANTVNAANKNGNPQNAMAAGVADYKAETHKKAPNAVGVQGGMGPAAPKGEGFADLSAYEGPAEFGSAEAPAGCYPRDQLTPSELLPRDMNSIWAEQNPMGPGSLKGKNFLSAGALIGVNTVGQSLRNANLQVRSEPPNPQVAVSIFNQSTISPDISHRPLEIGA